MRKTTASSLGRVVACPASASLPAVFEEAGAAAVGGTSKHLFLQRVTDNGRKAALSATPDDERDICAAIATEWIEAERKSARAEQAYAYNALNGSSVCLGRLDRDYPSANVGDMFCTVDLFVDDPAAPLMVVDYKTGRHRVTPCRDNWQMRLCALAVARHKSADAVLMRVAYLQEDGSWDFDDYKADAMDLDAWAADLRITYLAAEQASAAVTEGRVPDVHPSEDGCRWCPSVRACPAQTALARVLPPTLDDIAGRLEAMTPAQLGESWEVMVRCEALLKKIRTGLETVLTQSPFAMPSGKTLRMVETQREYIDGDVAYRVISELVSPQAADKVCSRSATKTAFKVLGKEQGRVLDAVRAAGGIDVKTYRNPKEVAE